MMSRKVSDNCNQKMYIKKSCAEKLTGKAFLLAANVGPRLTIPGTPEALDTEITPSRKS